MATAQSPGHITGFFAIYKNGSTGAGLNIENGMVTKTTILEQKIKTKNRLLGKTKEKRKDLFKLNGKKAKLIVSEKVLALFRKKTGKKEKVAVEHSTEYPIGYGLGISGAGALSLAISLDKLFKTKLSRKEITEIAKQAEIESGTGLGDVTAENYSGAIIGKKPYPSKEARSLKLGKKFVVMGFFAPIKTKKIIRNKKWMKKINDAGKKCMREMEKNGARKFIETCRKFTIESELGTRRIRKVMEKIPKASMAMLGETVFILTNKPKETEKELRKYCKRIMIAKIARKGAN